MLNRRRDDANPKPVVTPGIQGMAVIVVTGAHSLVSKLGSVATLSAGLAGGHLDARVNLYRHNGFGSGGVAVSGQIGAGNLEFVDLLGLGMHRSRDEGPHPSWASVGSGVRRWILADGDAVADLDVLPPLARGTADDFADALVRPLPHSVMPWASWLGARVIKKEDDGPRCRLTSIHLTRRVTFVTK